MSGNYNILINTINKALTLESLKEIDAKRKDYEKNGYITLAQGALLKKKIGQRKKESIGIPTSTSI